jgi:hypothetical protein
VGGWGAATLMVLRARRRRAGAAGEEETPDEPFTADFADASAAPLVRRRDTWTDDVPDEDFEVVMRSSREELS